VLTGAWVGGGTGASNTGRHAAKANNNASITNLSITLGLIENSVVLTVKNGTDYSANSHYTHSGDFAQLVELPH
jgi:hypothetical protein